MLAGEYEENQAANHYNQGVSCHEQGDIDSAIIEYKESIKWNSGLYQSYYNLGIIYASRKNYSDAKLMFKKVTELEPYSYDAHYNLGIMYAETKDIESAVYELEKATFLKPDSEQAHLALGSVYAQNNQELKAISEFRKAYSINPHNAEVKEILDSYDKQTYKKTSSSSTKNTDDLSGWVWPLILIAIFGWKFITKIFHYLVEMSKKILRQIRDPLNRSNRLILKAKKMRELRNFRKAQLFSGKALVILTSPESLAIDKHAKRNSVAGHSEVYKLQISTCYIYAKSAYLSKNISIGEILGEVQKVVSWDYSLSYLLGELFYLKNDFKKSLDCFTKLANTNNDMLVNLWLGILNYKVSNYEQGLKALEGVDFPIQRSDIKEEYLLDDHRELSIYCLQYKGLCCYALKYWNKAISCFELIEKEYSIDVELKHYLSQAYFNTKNYPEALRTINECLETEPSNLDLLIERAKIYKHIGKLEDAEEIIKSALTIASDNHKVYYELAVICSLRNNFNDALVCFNKSIQLHSDNFAAYCKKGILYEKNICYDKAIESYLLAIKADEQNPLPNTRIGISYCKQGKYRKALPYFEKALDLGDNTNQALYFSGLAYVNTNNLNAGLAKWLNLSKNNKSDTVLYKDVVKLKDLIINREKYLYGELKQEIGRENWYKSYRILDEIKNSTTNRNTVLNCMSYVRNRLLPELLRHNKRAELSDILKSGLKDNPTNYSLLHNISVLYYWWTNDSEQNNFKSIYEYKLWENLIGYWTTIVNNDEFWNKWAKRKIWIKKNDDLDLHKIGKNLMSNLETKVLSSIERSRQQNDKDSLTMYKDSLKKIHTEMKFVSYYKELKNILSLDISAIPDMYSETLIRDLGIQNYIIELTDLAIQKEPCNEKIRKIKYYLSPFRYIALLVEDENFEAAIKEIEALPPNCKNNNIVCDLMNLSKLKLGATYLQNDNIINHILKTEKIWRECNVADNGISIYVIETAAINAMTKYKSENKNETAICAGELALKFIPNNLEIKILLSILLNDRGVEKWNSGLTDFSDNSGISDLKRALEYNPNYLKAKRNLSIIYNLIGWKHIAQKETNDNVKDMFEKSLELDKDNEDAKKGIATYYNNLGIICANANKNQDATNCFLWALHYNPMDKTILRNLKAVDNVKYQEHVDWLKKCGIDNEEENA